MRMKNMFLYGVVAVLMTVAWQAGKSRGIGLAMAEEGHGHGEAKGPNGGEVQEIGDKDDHHVELIHDHTGGKVTLILLAKDVKTPVAIKNAPLINLQGKAGNKQVAMKPVDPVDGAASRWEGSDEAFKADPVHGRIAIELAGKKYQLKLDAHGGHDH